MSAAATLWMPGCAVARAAPAVPSPAADDGAALQRNAEAFERFVELMYRRRQVRAAFESCVVARGFVDHAPPAYAQRHAAIKGLAAALSAADPGGLQLLHTACQGDIGMVHLLAAQPTGARHRVEIYRLQDGRIVEHWSVVS